MTAVPRTACLTFDVDAMSAWITSARSDNPSMISRGEFAIVGVERILDLLRRHEARATFFVPGHTVLAFPGLVERIAAEGHELGHHGWGHENPADFDRDGEQRNLELGLAAFERVAGLRPVGYRSPAWALSPHTIELLLDAGFAYDSSCMGGDFLPYYLRSGDRWSSDEPYVFGETTSLVEVPVSWALDDVPHFELIPGLFNALASPEQVVASWRDEVDYLVDHLPAGTFTLTMHPECIGRAHRLVHLERLVAHIAGRGVAFASVGDVVRDFTAGNPLEDWKAANPARTGRDAIQSLAALEG